MAGKNWRDYLYIGFVTISFVAMFAIDFTHHYPESLVGEGRPLHILIKPRQFYLDMYQDPLTAASLDEQPSWFNLFIKMEMVFQLPMLVYIMAKYATASQGTSPQLELAAFAYGLQCSLTTAVCLWDIQYWDRDVYSSAVRNTLTYQLYGPWFAIPSLMAVDMYWRLLGRFSTAEDMAKKVQ